MCPPSQQLATRFEELEKITPWLKDEIPDRGKRQKFYEWVTDFADRHGWKGEDGKWTKMTPTQLCGVLDSNHGFYEKVLNEIERNSTTEFQAGHRFWPKRENLENAKETALAAIVVGSAYGIEPLFIITIAGYESQFANVKGLGGMGVCQVNERSSSVTALGKAYGSKTWRDKVNENLDSTGYAQIIRTPQKVDMMNIYQNVEEATRTMLLKATEGGGEGYGTISQEKYETLAALYNGNPKIQNEYAKRVMEYYNALAKILDGGLT